MLEQQIAKNSELLQTQNSLLAQLINLMIASGSTPVKNDTATQDVNNAESLTAEGENVETSKGYTLNSFGIAEMAYHLVLYPEISIGENDEIPSERVDVVAEGVINTSETPESLKADQLTMAALGVPALKAAHKHVQFAVLAAVVKHWDKLEGIDGRRDFIEKWLKTPAEKRDALKPAAAKKPKTEKPTVTEQEKTVVTETTTSTPPDENSANDENLGLQAKELFTKLASKARSEAVKVLKMYGAERYSEVPADRYGDFINALQIALEG